MIGKGLFVEHMHAQPHVHVQDMGLHRPRDCMHLNSSILLDSMKDNLECIHWIAMCELFYMYTSGDFHSP